MIRIRPATPCDAPALPGIERSSGAIFRHWAGLEWIADDDVQSEEQHRALIADGVAFVAELAGHGPTAFLNGAVMPDALHIWQVAVHQDRQGRGLGRQLIDAAQRHAVDHGLPCLTLTTFRTVPWNEPYYQRLGFVTLDDRQLGPRLQAVLDAERRAGLPIAQRCAMRKTL
ncbi:GNAT family N-acetyltransferase (plasmid) [Azospirillum brasilense]|uniref:GNAT family N-acetyltransferase n=2 Tax=Azospirillum brasilense TaxID=192 RepID=A0A4D8R2Q8_AZOBR|nr:GNAT family N-acetyltransferase [Azospirillum brasilense]